MCFFICFPFFFLRGFSLWLSVAAMEEIKQKFPVPPGFSALLESLAREVLRFQPDDIYTFSAIYFDVLLQLRSGKHQFFNKKVPQINWKSILENPKVDVLADKDIYDSLKRRLSQTVQV